MESPSPEGVRAQLDRICQSRHFRGPKLRKILSFLVDEWLRDGGKNLTAAYIGKSLGDEALAFEEDSDRWGYPKTRANLAHVRNRLRSYYETQGYRDPVTIKLTPGSYVPAIALNPVSAAQLELAPEVAALILRAKTAIDTRTLRGAWRAFRYFSQIPASPDNARQIANIAFIPMAIAPIIPIAPSAVRDSLGALIEHIKRSGREPWESIFAEACAEACYRHRWQSALELFELANATSQGETKYFWWFTALLASQGRIEEGIDILGSALRHFSRTHIGVRTDLALLQIMAGRFSEAEELLLGSFDFAPLDHPLLVCHLMILFEAQDRLTEASLPLSAMMQNQPAGDSSLPVEAFLRHRDLANLLGGMATLLAGRLGATKVAADLVDVMIESKARNPASPSIDIALGLIGLSRFDEAVLWLRKAAFEENDPWSMWFHIFPPFRHLRGNQTFGELLSSLKLRLPS